MGGDRRSLENQAGSCGSGVKSPQLQGGRQLADRWPQRCGRRTARARARSSWKEGPLLSAGCPSLSSGPELEIFLKGSLKSFF